MSFVEAFAFFSLSLDWITVFGLGFFFLVFRERVSFSFHRLILNTHTHTQPLEHARAVRFTQQSSTGIKKTQCLKEQRNLCKRKRAHEGKVDGKEKRFFRACNKRSPVNKSRRATHYKPVVLSVSNLLSLSFFCCCWTCFVSETFSCLSCLEASTL